VGFVNFIKFALFKLTDTIKKSDNLSLFESYKKMQVKIPKNSDKYQWTTHSVYKMHQYGLSEQKVRNVIRSPFRKEEGIVKDTVAVMQPVSPKVEGKKKIWKQEIWVMYQKTQNAKRKTQSEKENTIYKIPDTKYKIISVWRYPGISPQRNPIPEEILRELDGLGN